VKPTDPRIRRQLAPAQGQLIGVLVAGVMGSALVIAQAWAVTGLVLAALGEGDIVGWGFAVAVVFALRGVLGWGTDAVASSARR